MAIQIDMFSLGVAMAHYINDDGNFEFSADDLTSLLESHSYEEETPTKEQTPTKEKNTKTTKSKKNKFVDMTEEDIEAIELPESWSFAGHSCYLSTKSKDPETGKPIKTQKTFEEATRLANEIGEGCSGITLTSTGYSLRLFSMVRPSPLKDIKQGIASWVKAQEPSYIVDDDDVEYHGDEKQKILVAQEKERHAKALASKAEEVVESDDDDDDDEEAVATEVEEVVILNKTYYYDENDKTLYDPNTSEVVGGMNEEGNYYLN